MKITKGKKIKPLALLVYGVHGIGKTHFPSEANKPIYMGSEENDEIDADRLPQIVKWSDFLNQLEWLLKEGHQEYKTLVIDTIDMLEQVAQHHILMDFPTKTMETAFGGYGKAYKQMAKMFLGVRDNYLKKLRDEKGMNIILLAHADKSKHEDPITGESYDNYNTSIDKRVKAIFHDWVSGIFFINWELYKSENSEGKERLKGDGARVIYTQERPSHIAKNRFELPEMIEYNKEGTYKEIVELIKKHYQK